MDAYQSNPTGLAYSGEGPVLLAGTSDEALARAERTIGAAGLRIGARLPVAQAMARLELQGTAAAIWIEIDADAGRQMDELLRQVSLDASKSRYAAVVSAPLALLDPVIAQIEDRTVEVISSADEPTRIAALATAMAARRGPSVTHDVARDRNAERLRQLSDEVSRIASTLARLSVGPAAPPPPLERTPAGDIPPLSAETVRSVIRARRLRARYFQEELFADPAWDMLLDLLQAEIAQLRVPVSSLCIAAAVPATTALRWLKTMVAQGLFIRRADPRDGRRVFVELAPQASEALRRYFGEVGQAAVI